MLKVRMPDGIDLLADHYYASQNGQNDPIILIRSPYGRDSFWGLSSRMIAERGYQVLLQSVRGTFGSGGIFSPEINEASDGIATMRWLKDQKWFSGKVAMMGPSALGYAQWAVATNSPPEFLRAILPHITASEFRSMTYAGNSFSLNSFLSWVYLIQNQEKSRGIRARFNQRRGQSALKKIFYHVPLSEADELLFGTKVKIYQDVITNDSPDSKYWVDRDHSEGVKDVAIPVHLVGGWYDIFLPGQLKRL